MSKSLLAALLLAVAASAARAQSAVCAPNPELDAKSYALWVMDKTNPDETPCVARLAQVSCAPAAGAQTRTFVSADGRYTAVLGIAADGGVTVTLKLWNASGIGRGTAPLGTYPYRRAIFRAVGVDALQVFDDAAQAAKTIGNVLVIPADALTPGGQAMCPAD